MKKTRNPHISFQGRWLYSRKLRNGEPKSGDKTIREMVTSQSQVHMERNLDDNKCWLYHKGNDFISTYSITPEEYDRLKGILVRSKTIRSKKETVELPIINAMDRLEV